MGYTPVIGRKQLMRWAISLVIVLVGVLAVLFGPGAKVG